MITRIMERTIRGTTYALKARREEQDNKFKNIKLRPDLL